MRRLIRGETLVIATHNAGKLAELTEMMLPYGIKCVSAGDLGLPEPIESADTFSGNAEIKAKAACLASGLPALADDSGLSITALGGKPGVHSARFGKQFATYVDAMSDLARQLTGLSHHAQFNCALTLCLPSGEFETIEVTLDGQIVEQRGEHGFGYDAFFMPKGETRTFGEMTATQKHSLPPKGEGLSHRAKAFMLLSNRFFPV